MIELVGLVRRARLLVSDELVEMVEKVERLNLLMVKMVKMVELFEMVEMVELAQPVGLFGSDDLVELI